MKKIAILLLILLIAIVNIHLAHAGKVRYIFIDFGIIVKVEPSAGCILDEPDIKFSWVSYKRSFSNETMALLQIESKNGSKNFDYDVFIDGKRRSVTYEPVEGNIEPVYKRKRSAYPMKKDTDISKLTSSLKRMRPS